MSLSRLIFHVTLITMRVLMTVGQRRPFTQRKSTSLSVSLFKVYRRGILDFRAHHGSSDDEVSGVRLSFTVFTERIYDSRDPALYMQQQHMLPVIVHRNGCQIHEAYIARSARLDNMQAKQRFLVESLEFCYPYRPRPLTARLWLAAVE